ncbi:hypothetical protein C8D92_102175 [Tamilnaduibacter salinus]|uniref:Zinc resistance-associated protein n=1 Tax=Tamilnaduibacter salinus TaxID=1484056 RepID=A0A2U1CZC6_9GAMM|nr:hypothetical protein [Tamilnaduibacter salinus]PVY78139.1 hypothetical protein C8D92_102175 [Tamilnaduibacter salinus]
MNTMKQIVVCAILGAAPVWAFAHGEQGTWQGHGPGMMESDHMQQMNQNWSRMHGMMQRIPDADSAAERRKIMQEHWEAMDNQMELMHRGMMGPGMMQGHQGMMGDGMGEGMNGQSQSKDKRRTQSVDKRIEMMQQRMDQMQLMMEQMLEHQKQITNK